MKPTIGVIDEVLNLLMNIVKKFQIGMFTPTKKISKNMKKYEKTLHFSDICSVFVNYSNTNDVFVTPSP